MNMLDRMDEMAREHGAWMDVCYELRKLNVEPNSDEADLLMRAMRKWGEELHALRAKLDHATVTRALVMHRSDYIGRYELGTYPDRPEEGE